MKLLTSSQVKKRRREEKVSHHIKGEATKGIQKAERIGSANLRAQNETEKLVTKGKFLVLSAENDLIMGINQLDWSWFYLIGKIWTALRAEITLKKAFFYLKPETILSK